MVFLHADEVDRAAPPPVGAAPSPAWLTVEELATALRIPQSTVYEKVRLGQIPSIKIGKHRRVPSSWLNALVTAAQELPDPATKPPLPSPHPARRGGR